MQNINISFEFDGKTTQAQKGGLLSSALSQAGYAQDLVCGGNGKCGKCAVEIEKDGEKSTVLSCQYELTEDIKVIKIFNRADRKVNVLTANTELNCAINPMLSFLHVSGADIMPDHCEDFAGKIKEKFKLELSYPALKKLSRKASVDNKEEGYNLVVFNGTVIDINFGDDDDIYGLAVDIGSTTVAAYLYDMQNAKLINTYSSLNGQTALGADVISRIDYCIKNKDGVNTLRQKVSDTINKLLDDAKTQDGINTERIYHAVFCGNCTMQHLFLGMYPESLGKAPFVSTTHDTVQIKAAETYLKLNPECVITFLPLLGGFVGADTTAVLIGLPDDDKPRLAIDLGTNGELAVGTQDRYVIASTACGPALEGAGLTCGMRAAAGAVEHFTIDENKQVSIDVIGDVPATGICGSGIIDILAELIRNNVINARGKMLSREEYENKYGADELSKRLEKRGEINTFSISKEAGDVYFSQLDAREIQKAKAAIATGCIILIRNYGIKPEELEEICLAGAFGNYLDVDNAQLIGLFPKIEGVPVRSVGNGAGTGVQMYLLDKGSVKKCATVKKNAEHTELNFQEGFMDTYFDQMKF